MVAGTSSPPSPKVPNVPPSPLSTDGGGIDRVKRKLFNTVPGLHPWDVRSVAEDASGGMWAAFNAAGLSYWNSNRIHDFGIGSGQNASTVLVDRQQNVWAGTTSEGLFKFNSHAFVLAPGAEFLGPKRNGIWPEILAMFESSDGAVWVGSRNGLGRWDGQGWKMFTVADGLSGNTVSAVT